MIAGNSTDGLIEPLRAVPAPQTIGITFPPYDAVPVTRQAALESHPQVPRALETAGWHDRCRSEMRKLNFAVDGDKASAEGRRP